MGRSQQIATTSPIASQISVLDLAPSPRFTPLQIFDSRNAALAGNTIVVRVAVSCPSVYDLLVALLVAQWLGHLASSQAVASSNHQNHQLLGNCHRRFLHTTTTNMQ